MAGIGAHHFGQKFDHSAGTQRQIARDGYTTEAGNCEAELGP